MDADGYHRRFRAAGEFVERECLLFEAGDYPDRGVTVTPDDLRAIAAGTPREVPVRVEHLRESPFDAALGVVTRLRVVGRQLWGTLRQPVEAWRFTRQAGARALSVALDTAQGRLTEVSFVCRPRIAAAQVFREREGEGTRARGGDEGVASEESRVASRESKDGEGEGARGRGGDSALGTRHFLTTHDSRLPTPDPTLTTSVSSRH